MRFSEVLTQIVTEFTGESDRFLIEQFRSISTSYPELDKELSSEQAESLIRRSRDDPKGFIHFLSLGYATVIHQLDHI